MRWCQRLTLACLLVFAHVPATRGQPVINKVAVDASVLEGAVATLASQFTAPGGISLTLAINWGDGPAMQVLPLQSGTTNFSATHQYLAYHEPGKASVPATINLTLTANDGVSDSTFLSAIFQDFLGRALDPASRNYYLTYLASGGTRSGVVSSVTGSAEYRQRLVQDLYQRLLRRAANTAELNSGVNFLTSGGSDEQYMASPIGSPEYFQNRGNGANSGFLDALYFDLLDRPIDSSARSTLLAQLNSGTTPAQIASEILGGAEYRGDLVTALFWRLLHRVPISSEVSFYVNLLNSGTTDEQIMADIAGSPEYYNNRSGSTASARTSLQVLTAPSTIVSITVSGGIARVAGQGLASQIYELQSSSNLAGWTTLSSVTADQGGTFNLFDRSAAGSPNRFYRVLSL